MPSRRLLKCHACVASCLLSLATSVQNQRVDGARAIALNREHLVAELAQKAQCLVVKLRQRRGDDEPTEVEVRSRQLTSANPLRLEHLTESINGTRHIAQSEKALSAMMVNRGKLCVLSPLGQNHVEQLKSRDVSIPCVSGEKFVSLNARILRLVECATTTSKSREKLFAVFRRPSLSAKPVVSHARGSCGLTLLIELHSCRITREGEQARNARLFQHWEGLASLRVSIIEPANTNRAWALAITRNRDQARAQALPARDGASMRAEGRCGFGTRLPMRWKRVAILAVGFY